METRAGEDSRAILFHFNLLLALRQSRHTITRDFGIGVKAKCFSLFPIVLGVRFPAMDESPGKNFMERGRQSALLLSGLAVLLAIPAVVGIHSLCVASGIYWLERSIGYAVGNQVVVDRMISPMAWTLYVLLGLNAAASLAIAILAGSVASPPSSGSIVALRCLAFLGFGSAAALGVYGLVFFYLSDPYLWSHLWGSLVVLGGISFSLGCPSAILFWRCIPRAGKPVFR